MNIIGNQANLLTIVDFRDCIFVSMDKCLKLLVLWNKPVGKLPIRYTFPILF